MSGKDYCLCSTNVIDVKNPTPALIKAIEDLENTDFYKGSVVLGRGTLELPCLAE